MMPSLLPVSSWALRAPSSSWLHASNKSVWCSCKLSLAAALPDPHFHRKIIMIFGFCLPARKSCLHSSQHHWDFYKTCTLNNKDYCFICARRETTNFLTLVVKVSPKSSTTAFSTDCTFPAPDTEYFWCTWRKGRGPSLLRLCSALC